MLLNNEYRTCTTHNNIPIKIWMASMNYIYSSFYFAFIIIIIYLNLNNIIAKNSTLKCFLFFFLLALKGKWLKHTYIAYVQK